MVFLSQFRLKRFLICYLAIAVFLLPTAKGWGMFLPSDQMIQTSGEEIGKIQSFLESKIVAQRLSDLGLTAKEIASRLSLMSASELHEIATQIDTIYAGGDGFSSLAFLLIVALLVVVVLQATGYKVIITK